MRKGLSIDDVGVSRDTVFQEIRPGADFETGDFVKERLGELPKKDSPMNNHMAYIGIQRNSVLIGMQRNMLYVEKQNEFSNIFVEKNRETSEQQK